MMDAMDIITSIRSGGKVFMFGCARTAADDALQEEHRRFLLLLIRQHLLLLPRRVLHAAALACEAMQTL